MPYPSDFRQRMDDPANPFGNLFPTTKTLFENYLHDPEHEQITRTTEFLVAATNGRNNNLTVTLARYLRVHLEYLGDGPSEEEVYSQSLSGIAKFISRYWRMMNFDRSGCPWIDLVDYIVRNIPDLFDEQQQQLLRRQRPGEIEDEFEVEMGAPQNPGASQNPDASLLAALEQQRQMEAERHNNEVQIIDRQLQADERRSTFDLEATDRRAQSDINVFERRATADISVEEAKVRSSKAAIDLEHAKVTTIERQVDADQRRAMADICVERAKGDLERAKEDTAWASNDGLCATALANMPPNLSPDTQRVYVRSVCKSMTKERPSRPRQQEMGSVASQLFTPFASLPSVTPGVAASSQLLAARAPAFTPPRPTVEPSPPTAADHDHYADMDAMSDREKENGFPPGMFSKGAYSYSTVGCIKVTEADIKKTKDKNKFPSLEAVNDALSGGFCVRVRPSRPVTKNGEAKSYVCKDCNLTLRICKPQGSVPQNDSHHYFLIQTNDRRHTHSDESCFDVKESNRYWDYSQE